MPSFGLPRREGGVMGVMEEQSGAGTRANINGGLCPVQQPSAQADADSAPKQAVRLYDVKSPNNQ